MRVRRLFSAFICATVTMWVASTGGSGAAGVTACTTYDIKGGSVCVPDDSALGIFSSVIAEAQADLTLAKAEADLLISGGSPSVDTGYTTAVAAVADQISAATARVSRLRAKARKVEEQLVALAVSLQAAADATTGSARQAALVDAYERLVTVMTASVSLQLRVEKAQADAGEAQRTAAAAANVYAGWVLENVDAAHATALTSMDAHTTEGNIALGNALLTVDTLVAGLGSAVTQLRGAIGRVSDDGQAQVQAEIAAALVSTSAAVSDAQARAAASMAQVDATNAGVTHLADQSPPAAADEALAAASTMLRTAEATATNLTATLVTVRNQLDMVAASATAALTRPSASSQRVALADAESALAETVAKSESALTTADELEVQVRSVNGSLVEAGSTALGLEAAQVVAIGIANMDIAEDAVNSLEALETAASTLLDMSEQLEQLVNDAAPDLPVDPSLPEVVIPVLPPRAYAQADTDTGAVFAAPSTSWLKTHCRATRATAMTNRHVLHAIIPYSGFAGAPQVSGYSTKMRAIIRAMDRALEESHGSFTQHYRLVCYKDAAGNWANIAATRVLVPKSADLNANKKIGCDEADTYLRSHLRWGDPKVRRLRFYDASINTGGPYKGYCNYGDSVALGDKTPGPTNKNNRVFGYGNLDADYWPQGATNYTTAVGMQEIGHSLGIVGANAPGADSGYHTKDYPDYMNAGYYTPLDGNIRKNCGTVSTTFRDTFVDCGKDTYWDPYLSKTQWLCTRYNLATDSLYFRPLASRPSACPPA